MTGQYYLEDTLDKDARDDVASLTPPGHVHLAAHNGQAQGLLGLPVHLHQPLVAPELGRGGLHLTLNKEKCFRPCLPDKVCQEYSD